MSGYMHTTNDSNYIEDLTYAYRRECALGLPGYAAQELLDYFDKFINKFYKLLIGKRGVLEDRDLELFVALFGKLNIYSVSKLLLSSYESDDILIETQVALLETARKYGSIWTNYKYVLKKQILTLLHDPLVYTPPVSLGDDGLVQVEDNYFSELEDYWVAGITTSDAFSKLSDKERVVIKYRYVDGLRVSEIANKMRVNRRTVSRWLKSGIEILREYKQEE